MKKVSTAILICSIFLACNDNKDTTTATSDTTVNTADHTAVATPVDSTANAPVMADSTFVANAASGGMMEVELGRMAEQKATNKRVKNFAAMMVKDHTAANAELKSVAKQNNIMVPTALMPDQRQHVTDMKGMTGKDFEKHYMDMMVNDHVQDINMFKDASNNPNNRLKDFATKTLPVLQKHLDSAQAIHSSIP